jgi:hypothetical protein
LGEKGRVIGRKIFRRDKLGKRQFCWKTIPSSHRGQFTNGNGEEDGGPPSNNGSRGGAEMIWKEAAQQRKGQKMMMNGTGGKTKVRWRGKQLSMDYI